MSVTIKSDREIELMREAGKKLAFVHSQLAKEIKPGMSTLDVDRIGEEIIRSLGGRTVDVQITRQQRFEPPSGFPLTSPYSGIVHHLSGPNIYAHTQTLHAGSVDVGTLRLHTFHFHSAYEFFHSHTCI